MSLDASRDLNMDLNTIPSRIAALKAAMLREGISAVMVPTSDYHNSEYVDAYFKCREYLSGFTGSNGTLVVTADKAGLWTDGRYFIQAENELKGSGISLYKMGEPGVPKILEFLKSEMKENDVLAFDGRVVPAKQGIAFENEFKGLKVTISYEKDLPGMIWNDRPRLPQNSVFYLPQELSGESAESKIKKIRDALKTANSDAWVCSKLDDIMWLLNIRGGDVECNPVALSYVYLTKDELFLFVQKEELQPEVCDYLTSIGVSLREYAEINNHILASNAKTTMLDLNNINLTLYKLVLKGSKVVDRANPTEALKSIKNETELTNIRDAYLKDSVALTRFIFWLKKNVGTVPMDEMSVAARLDEFRRNIPGFIDLSFPTISAYADNAAIVHYEANDETNKTIKADGMYLVDSGGQYMGGTTDVTRTIVLGKISDIMKRHFTLVCQGMLRLADAIFLEGCTGRNIDILARNALWREFLDYKHGTGHGIGYILNVHEGPQNIRYRYIDKTTEALLKPGMIVSDEPGLYITGEYGIRTENILEVINIQENEYGKFYGFKHLTYVPIDLDGIDSTLLDDKDRELLNDYHKAVYDKLVDFMESEEEKGWLAEVTRSI